jgi:hypothetical protein
MDRARTNLARMPYTTADAQRQLLDSVITAGEALGSALASLTEAYELLDEQTAERLEADIFRPVQSAYGRARRTQTEFAGRHGLPDRSFEPAVRGAPANGVKGFLDAALREIADADRTLATLQDSMLPVEVGDAELRAGLEQVRSLLGAIAPRARELMRTFGR